MTPLRLTDEQLNQVMRTAAPIPLHLRDEYLQRVADQLRGLEFGDGEIYRVCRTAAKAVMWNAQRASPRALRPVRCKARNRLPASVCRPGQSIANIGIKT